MKVACAVQSDAKLKLSSQRSVQCFYVISLSGDYFYLNRTLIYIIVFSFFNMVYFGGVTVHGGDSLSYR